MSAVTGCSTQDKAVFETQGFPTLSHEDWLYWVPDTSLQSTLLAPVPTEKKSRQETEAVVVLNGRLTGAPNRQGVDVYTDRLPKTVEACLKYRIDSTSISTLNATQYPESITVHITQAQDSPLHIDIVNDVQGAQTAVTRVVLVIDPGVEATVTMQHHFNGAAESASNTTVEVCCLAGAVCQLTHVLHPSEAPSFFHSILHMYADSRCVQTTVLTENTCMRSDTEAHFYEEGAHLELKGVAVLEANQQHYTHLKANHYTKNCFCSQVFKTVLSGQATAEFSGLVSVEKGAHGVDSQQLNQNLLLSDSARVLSRPQLKIDADDVQCAHGSTVGQLNPDEVFYICSRGLSLSEARVLLISGFTEEIVMAIADEPIQRQVSVALKQRIARLNTTNA